MRTSSTSLGALVCTLLVAAATVLAACGQDDDPAGAETLWQEINAGTGFQSWSRAPSYPSRRPSFTSHNSAVEIFVNPTVQATLTTETATAVTEWPVGSIIVKEGFSSLVGGSRRSVAAIEKRADGWFWAEYDDSGKSKYSGRPSVCTDCHDNRKSYSDWVYAFELPR